MSEGMIITTAGRNLLALALTGKELHFTRAAVGDGQLGSRSALGLTGLISQKRELAIQSMRVSATGTAEVVLEVSNKGVTQGFWLREYGLFARNPDTGAEVLYAYCNKGNEAGYLEAESGGSLINFVLTVITVIDQAKNITATISTTNNYVTISRLEGRIDDLFAKTERLGGFWTYTTSADQRLRPVEFSEVKSAILGVTDIASLNSRVERLEDTMAQTLLELEMREIYPGYNHYIIEDFKNPDQIDSYNCRVTSVVAGDDSIDCEPLDGMLPGSWYTLSDGMVSEAVLVQSINLENGVQRVILNEPVRNTYYLNSARLYRTSANITELGARGSGGVQVLTWQPNFSWQGQGMSSAGSTELNTVTGNGAAFMMSGDMVLNASGMMTLGG